MTLGANLEDPWNMSKGFATQMVFIFIDTDGKEGSGHTDAPPGLNVQFAPASAWDKLVILSPQEPARVRKEVETKAAGMKGDILIPERTKGAGRKITGTRGRRRPGNGRPEPVGLPGGDAVQRGLPRRQ